MGVEGLRDIRGDGDIYLSDNLQQWPAGTEQQLEVGSPLDVVSYLGNLYTEVTHG